MVLLTMNVDLKNSLLKMYDTEMKKCPCVDTKDALTPWIFWYIGKNFPERKSPKIAFVGKNSWGESGEKTGNKPYCMDGLTMVKGTFNKRGEKNAPFYDCDTERVFSRYWGAIKNITKKSLEISSGNCSFLDEIYVTNLCKCN
jgi:hypothetical protein